MSMQAIAIISQKGSVGKITVALHLAAATSVFVNPLVLDRLHHRRPPCPLQDVDRTGTRLSGTGGGRGGARRRNIRGGDPRRQPMRWPSARPTVAEVRLPGRVRAMPHFTPSPMPISQHTRGFVDLDRPTLPGYQAPMSPHRSGP